MRHGEILAAAGRSLAGAHCGVTVRPHHTPPLAAMMQENLKLDPEVAEAYFQTFGLAIPVGPWSSEGQLRRAEVEARKAIARERDVLSPNEFPTDTPDGALS